MPYVELQYPFMGKALPSDHGYALFSAISGLVPEIHAADWLAIETVAGTARGDGVTQLDEHARLRVRLPQERVPLLLKLAGQRLDVAGHAAEIECLRDFGARAPGRATNLSPEAIVGALFADCRDQGVHRAGAVSGCGLAQAAGTGCAGGASCWPPPCVESRDSHDSRLRDCGARTER